MDMPPLDLYAVLGLERTPAPKPEKIKEAFRNVAMRIHPDQGGGRDEYEQAQLAYQVLSDPNRRRRYDATGDTSDPRDHKHENHGVLLAIVENLMEQVISSDVDLTKRDPIAHCREAVTKKQGEILRLRKDGARAIERIETVLKRLQRKAAKRRLLGLLEEAPQPDLVEQVTRKKLAVARAAIEDLDRMRNIWANVGDLLNDYTYKVDPPTERRSIFSGDDDPAMARFLNPPRLGRF